MNFFNLLLSFLTDELMQQARAVGERTKALEASKMKTTAAKTPAKKPDQQRTKRELFCRENLQEIEESLLGSEEPTTAEENMREKSEIR